MPLGLKNTMSSGTTSSINKDNAMKNTIALFLGSLIGATALAALPPLIPEQAEAAALAKAKTAYGDRVAHIIVPSPESRSRPLQGCWNTSSCGLRCSSSICIASICSCACSSTSSQIILTQIGIAPHPHDQGIRKDQYGISSRCRFGNH